MIYRILSNSSAPQYGEIKGKLCSPNGGLIPNFFTSGKSQTHLAQPGEKFQLLVDSDLTTWIHFGDRIPTIVHSTSPLLVISKKAQKQLANLTNDRIEFFDLIIRFGENVFENYYIVNLLDKIDCIDPIESDVEYETYNEKDQGLGAYIQAQDIVFIEGKIPLNCHLFLLGNVKSPFVVMSEYIINKFEQNKVTNFVSLPLNEFGFAF